MTKEEAITKLNALGSSSSPSNREFDHIIADSVLVNFLADNGFFDVAEAYREATDRVGFWYS